MDYEIPVFDDNQFSQDERIRFLEAKVYFSPEFIF